MAGGRRRSGRRCLSAAGPPFDDAACSGCGAVVPSVDTSQVLMEKVSELARFGLSAGERPLLRHAQGMRRHAAPSGCPDGRG